MSGERRTVGSDWRAESLSSDEVWAIRELISVLRKPYRDGDDEPDQNGVRWSRTSPPRADGSLVDDDRKALFLIHKCEKNGVDVERCRRILDILDLDTDVSNERLTRYRKAT